MKTTVKFALKVSAVLTIAVGIVTTGFDVSESRATLTEPSGKCAFTITLNTNGMNARYANWGGSPVTTSSAGVIDFNAKTISYTDTWTRYYGQPNAVTTNYSGSTTFTLAAGEFSGLYVLTSESGGKMNIVSTNSGNTLLMAGRPSSNSNEGQESGVCQAL